MLRHTIAMVATGGLSKQSAKSQSVGRTALLQQQNVTTRFGNWPNKSIIVLLVSLSIVSIAASSSIDTPTEQQTNGQPVEDFAGDFGEPLVKAESQARKREVSDKPRPDESKPRLTTLLEDEDEQKEEIKAASSAANDYRASFGRVVETPPAAQVNASPSYLGSLFTSLKKRIASYWPSWAWGSDAVGPTKRVDAVSSSAAGSNEQHAPSDEWANNERPEIGASKQQHDANNKAQEASDRQSSDARLHSSAPHEMEPASGGEQQDEDRKDKKLIRVRLERDDDSIGTHKRMHLETSADTPAVGSQFESAEHRAPESLVGKYVYAPTQHYYWTGAPLASGSWPSDAPGGDEQLRPAYAFQKDTSQHFAPLMLTTSSTGGQQVATKSQNNDLYFLVMVGAFCMMAVAVVLAAGLFAYRVQQHRKSSQAEPEYPTYGVVGPNNMHVGHGVAKCGAAAFMGGHLGAPAGLGSAKHLPDLYRQQTGNDSGLASLDRICASKKSSAPSSLAGHGASAADQQRHLAQSQDAARMYHYQHQKQQMIVSDRSSAGRHTSASDLDSDDENDDGSYTVYECPGLASAHEMEIKNPLFNDERTP